MKPTIAITHNAYREALGFPPLCLFVSLPGHAQTVRCTEIATSVVTHWSTARNRWERARFCGEHGRIVADTVAAALEGGVDCR